MPLLVVVWFGFEVEFTRLPVLFVKFETPVELEEVTLLVVFVLFPLV